MGFWQGVADWFGLNSWDSPGHVFGNIGKIASGPVAPFIHAWSDGPGGYTGADAFREGALGPGVAGIRSALQDVVSDISEGISSIDDMKTLSENLGAILGRDTDSDAINKIMAYFTSPGVEADLQREFNREEADLAVERARELRRTQYIDAKEGLEAAGLNPVLAAGGGIGGSSSVAPMATSSAAQGTRAVDVISSLAMLLQALTGGVANIADAFGSHKTIINKVFKK